MFLLNVHIKLFKTKQNKKNNSPALNHFDCILLVSNDTEFGQKFKQVVTLYHQISLDKTQSDVTI